MSSSSSLEDEEENEDDRFRFLVLPFRTSMSLAEFRWRLA